MTQLELFTEFNPKFLHELVYDLYENESESVKEFMVKEVLKDINNKGKFWEYVLEKHMKHHTTLLEHNAWHMDFDDGTDAKFATAARYQSGVFQASIGIENKTGTLRVCMVNLGSKFHKLYFMLIPYSFYSTRNPESPLKITFRNFQPCGEIWDKFKCTWKDVIKSVDK
jgi:hypothetical protein